MTTARVRPATPDDARFLGAMIVEAGFWRATQERPPFEEALKRPDLAVWIADWGGRAGDAGVIAEDDAGRPVGAAWYRRWTDDHHSYGYVAADVPELAIAVSATWRGQGVGRDLLLALVALARDDGHSAISLSVEKDNPAMRLYADVGFEIHADDGGAYTMIKRIEA